MNYLPKFLAAIKSSPVVFQQKDVNYVIGLTTTQVKDLKREAVSSAFVKELKREYFLTDEGEKYLQNNPVVSWVGTDNDRRPEINLEYLKLEKAPPTLTRAIRLLARHLIDGEALKENSTEHYLVKELLCPKSTCVKIKDEIEMIVLNGFECTGKIFPDKVDIDKSAKKVKLQDLFNHFTSPPYGLTKSIVAVLLLEVLVKNKEVLAIYEDLQFQLKLDPLMFDRMIYCPQKFEIQKTVLEDMEILEGISQVVLPCKSKNILDLTKGLIHFIRGLEKYTLSTECLDKATTRFRNVVLNAKDPITLFYRDIPKVLNDKLLCQCDEKFLKIFEETIEELQDCYISLVKKLMVFFLESFGYGDSFMYETARFSIVQRFDAIGEYIGDNELKILHNNIKELTSTDKLWIERIATFINKSRVPKDWSDNDVADFKVKVKELALKFQAIEATAGTSEVNLDNTMQTLLNQLQKLTKAQQMTILRQVVNQ